MSSIIRSALALTMAGIALGGAQSCTPKTDTGSLPVKIVVRDEPQEMVAGEDGTFHFKIPVGYIPKGGVIDFNVNVNTTPACSKYYVTEFLAGKTWYKGDMFMCTGIENGPGAHPTTVMQTFRMPESIKGELDIRFRPTGREKADTSSYNGGRASMSLVKYGYIGEYVQYFGTAEPKDTMNVLCIGNSFTYFHGGASMLKEIAWNEGHFLRIKASLKGGQTLGQHFALPLSRNVSNVGHYDFAFLQDQSQAPANYAKDSVEFAYVKDDFLKLADRVISRSAGCRFALEDTWAYEGGEFGGFGSYEEFDRLMDEGTARMAAAAAETFGNNEFCVSPIGKAFSIVRTGDSGIDLYDTDRKHQSEYGSYLKACVNYLILTGERFHSQPDPASLTSVDCDLPHEQAAYLRGVAEQVMGLR